MKRRLPLWLVIALTLGLPELGAQQSKDTVVRIPPGSDLRATLENQTAKVKFQGPLPVPSMSWPPDERCIAMKRRLPFVPQWQPS